MKRLRKIDSEKLFKLADAVLVRQGHKPMFQCVCTTKPTKLKSKTWKVPVPKLSVIENFTKP